MHIALVGAEFEENLAVRYLRGALKHDGHEVTTVVFNDREGIEAAAQELVSSGTALAGFSMVFTYRAQEFARLAERARDLGYAGHIVAGGHFAAFHAQELLRDVPAFDSVASGEGETILCELCRTLPDVGKVPGLVWRERDDVIRNAPAIKPPDLDSLPFPPRKSPFDEYLGIPITNILSSRGCTRTCAFCSIAAWHRMCGGPKLRLRKPTHLADEMEELFRRGVRIFNFHDDNFVLDSKPAMLARLRAIREQWDGRGLLGKIAFAIKCRPDVVDADVFAALEEMGMFRVFLGVEAGTAESLRQLGRGQRVSDNVRALDILNRLDIHTCFNLLVLNPDSSLEDFAANVDFLRRHPHNAMNFCRTEVYTGTPLEHRLRQENRLLGTYWGWDYAIADSRAQLAFEIIYPAFEARNYGEEGLHHLTMQIDYEQQLLRRFFGRGEALRRRVKKLIVEVNLNTCRHLGDVIASVPRLSSDADREAYAQDLRARVERDNARLGARVSDLLCEIRLARRRVPRGNRGRWARTAATAGLAASVTIASACREKSHATETVAIPTGSATGAPPKPDAKPDVSPDTGTGSTTTLPAGPAALVKPLVGKELLPFLKKKVVPADVVEIELWIDEQGKVSKALLHRPRLARNVEDEILDRTRAMTFSGSNVRGQRFVVYFSKEDVAGKPPVTKPRPTTHMKERIPPRPEMAPPRPEMAPPRPEMAPKPPRN